MHNNDEINEAIQHFKLTKKDQQLLVAGATLMTVATAGAMATTTNAHADIVKNNNVKTEQVNKVNNNVNNGWHANSVAQIKQAIQKQGGNVYTIQYGDTLSAIAQAMNINMTTLQQINHIANANVIIAGNKIGFSADHQNVQVMNNQGKVIAQAPVHTNAPVAPVVNHAVATPVAHVQAPVAHITTVNKPVTTTHTEYVPQQVTTTKEVPTQVTTNQTKTVTKNVPVTTTDANGNQTTTMKPETTTETVPVTTTVNKPVTTTTTVNKPVTVTDTTNQPTTTTTTTTPSQTPSSSVDNASSSVTTPTTSTTDNSNVDNSSSSNANTANSGQLVNGYTPQQSSSSSASANSSSNTSSSADSSSNVSSSSQASQSSSSNSMSNGYQPQDNQNSNSSNVNSADPDASVNTSTKPQFSEYSNTRDGWGDYFNASANWWQANGKGNLQKNANQIEAFRTEFLKDINLLREQHGLAPVTMNSYINQVAQAHAEQDAKYDDLTHMAINADGTESKYFFAEKYVYDHDKDKGKTLAFNTEGGFTSDFMYTDPYALADMAVSGLCADDNHFNGMLNDKNNQMIGVDIAQGSTCWYGSWDSFTNVDENSLSSVDNSMNVEENGQTTSVTYPDGVTGTISSMTY